MVDKAVHLLLKGRELEARTCFDCRKKASAVRGTRETKPAIVGELVWVRDAHGHRGKLHLRALPCLCGEPVLALQHDAVSLQNTLHECGHGCLFGGAAVALHVEIVERTGEVRFDRLVADRLRVARIRDTGEPALLRGRGLIRVLVEEADRGERGPDNEVILHVLEVRFVIKSADCREPLGLREVVGRGLLKTVGCKDPGQRETALHSRKVFVSVVVVRHCRIGRAVGRRVRQDGGGKVVLESQCAAEDLVGLVAGVAEAAEKVGVLVCRYGDKCFAVAVERTGVLRGILEEERRRQDVDRVAVREVDGNGRAEAAEGLEVQVPRGIGEVGGEAVEGRDAGDGVDVGTQGFDALRVTGIPVGGKGVEGACDLGVMPGKRAVADEAHFAGADGVAEVLHGGRLFAPGCDGCCLVPVAVDGRGKIILQADLAGLRSNGALEVRVDPGRATGGGVGRC